MSISDSIESAFQQFEKKIDTIDKTTEVFQKKVIHKTIVNKNLDRFVKRQRQINALKSPFIKVRDVLQNILGENVEEIQVEELIDTSSQEEEHERAKKILDCLQYVECIEYFKEAMKTNLKRVNNKWSNK